ncbi:NAC domain-containing protein 67 [Cocos nucifera]|nr:NAC domain-containing protein 67 [Cocos nucifera]
MGDEEKFPAGFRFNPTKVELIEQYLKRKVSGKPLPSDIIKEVELYDLQPEVLHDRFPNKRIQSRYFFTKLDKRFRNKKHRDRKVKNWGRWICGVGDRPVIKKGGRYTGGVYKTLTYREGNDKSKKTGWIMTEYRLSGESKQHQPTANLESDWLLCEIHYKGNKAKDDEGDDYKEEDKVEDQEEPDGRDQWEEGIGKSKPEPWLAYGASTSHSFACHGDDQIPLSRGEDVQAADASTSYRFDTCNGGGQFLCSGEEEVQSACAPISYSFSTCCGDHQTLFHREVQAANASTSYSSNSCYAGWHIPLDIEDEVQAIGASTYGFSTYGFSQIPPNIASSIITSNTADLLPDFTHLSQDMAMDIPGSSQVAALLSSDGTGVDRYPPPLGDSHIVTGTGIEGSPLEQAPVPFACDWITENPQELETFIHLIQQDFPNLDEDMASLPPLTEAASPNNAQPGQKGQLLLPPEER